MVQTGNNQDMKIKLQLQVSEAMGETSRNKVTIRNIDLSMHQCASFYELETGTSFVERDLIFTEGSDRKIRFKFSATDCDDFKLAISDSKAFKIFMGQNEFEVY